MVSYENDSEFSQVSFFSQKLIPENYWVTLLMLRSSCLQYYFSRTKFQQNLCNQLPLSARNWRQLWGKKLSTKLVYRRSSVTFTYMGGIYLMFRWKLQLKWHTHGNIRGNFREHSGKSQGMIMENSKRLVNIPGTFSPE